MGPLSRISRLGSGRSRRSSSYDRSGGNADFAACGPGETIPLLDVQSAGVVRHIWITTHQPGDALSRRNLILRAWWDGEERPSIQAPLGDFFGQGWGLAYPFSSLPLAAAPMQGRGLVSYLPMPFADAARIEIWNDSDAPLERLYFYVDWEELPALENGEGRLNAWWNTEITRPETASENEWELFGPYENHAGDSGNYLWCEAEGCGHFIGINHFVNCPSPIWYGEGDDMFLIDGEPWPGLHGTGTEDYFNTSWSPAELYSHPCFGIAYAPGLLEGGDRFGWLGRAHLYRFHLDDPIRFSRSLKASIEHGHANCLTMEIASCAYWYQDAPAGPRPLAGRAEREPKPLIQPVDIHAWRQAWLDQNGAGSWGSRA
jgi:hypothetical protein